MSTTASLGDSPPSQAPQAPNKGTLEALVGSGDKIAMFALPFVIVGLSLNFWRPSFFSVGGPDLAVTVLAISMLIPGVSLWLWSAALIVMRVPRGKLITHGPYALLKHPLYTSVALLVLPALGFVFDSWLGIVFGAALYAGSRIYSPEEERELAQTFGAAWDAYCKRVLIPWL